MIARVVANIKRVMRAVMVDVKQVKSDQGSKRVGYFIRRSSWPLNVLLLHIIRPEHTH
jgi:hypothetical protein